MIFEQTQILNKFMQKYEHFTYLQVMCGMFLKYFHFNLPLCNPSD